MKTPDHYEILQVSPQAETAVILAAYKNLAPRYHPDHHRGDPNAEQRMKQLNEAKDVLSDPIRRRAYDARRSAEQQDMTRRAQEEATQRLREALRREYQETAARDWQKIQEEAARRLREERQKQEQQQARRPPSVHANSSAQPKREPRPRGMAALLLPLLDGREWAAGFRLQARDLSWYVPKLVCWAVLVPLSIRFLDSVGSNAGLVSWVAVISVFGSFVRTLMLLHVLCLSIRSYMRKRFRLQHYFTKSSR